MRVPAVSPRVPRCQRGDVSGSAGVTLRRRQGKPKTQSDLLQYCCLGVRGREVEAETGKRA